MTKNVYYEMFFMILSVNLILYWIAKRCPQCDLPLINWVEMLFFLTYFAPNCAHPSYFYLVLLG